MFTKKFSLLLSIILLATFTSTAYAKKSVYAITDHGWRPGGSSAPAKIAAYGIDGDQITLQEIFTPDPNFYQTGASHGPIDLAVDSDSAHLFVTYEGDNFGVVGVEVVNAKSMTEVDYVPAPGASDLAGIVFDEGKQKLYTVGRGTDRLFVYTWNPATKTLNLDGGTYKTLTNLGSDGACGLALDEIEDMLYVTKISISGHKPVSNTVYYYDTNDFSYQDAIDITVGSNNRNAVGVAVYNDGQGTKYLYTGTYSFDLLDPGHQYLVRTDLNDPNDPNSFIEKDIGASATDISVDPDTGLVYVTTSNNRVAVYDTSGWPSDPNQTVEPEDYETDYISGPAGICVPTGDVSYKPPLFYLEKVDVNEPNSVLPGDYITYEITYGPNGVDHNNVVITDYLPYEVDFNSASGPNIYDSNTHTVTWNIGHLDADDPCYWVTLTVKVNEGADPNGIITNYCQIESDTAYSTTTAFTNVGPWQPDSEIIYVDSLSPCAPGTGMSWRFAYRDLQDALERAAYYGSEIWVAEGMYKPTTNPADSDANFGLVDGVGLYGGFAGNETSRSQRNWLSNETTLSGDVDDNGTADVLCVVTASGVGETAIIDGFTIRKASYGIWIIECSPTISHNRITENSDCGILCSYTETPLIKNNWIHHNGFYGIWFYSPNAVATVRNNTVVYNTNSGIIRPYGTSPNITNCILWANDNDLSGCSATYSCIQNDDPGEGNITGDANNPQFVDADNNDYHIASDSPCIDAGDPNFSPDPNDPNETDIDGEQRIIDGDQDGNAIVDMGADEVACLIGGNAGPLEHSDWLAWGTPDCWCYQRQCRGDVDGLIEYDTYWVFSNDLNLFKISYGRTVAQLPPNGICCDLDHQIEYGTYRVFANDLAIFKLYYGKNQNQVPKCNQPLIYTGPYNFWIDPNQPGEGKSAAEPVDIGELIKWLEELWLTDEQVRERYSEAEWLEFIETARETSIY